LHHNFHSKERATDRVRKRKMIKRARWKRREDGDGKEGGRGSGREKMKIYERQRQYQNGWSSKLLPNEGYCWSGDSLGHSCVAMGSALCAPPPGMKFCEGAEWDYIRNENTDVNGWVTSEEEPTRYRVWTCEVAACSAGSSLEPKLLPSTRWRKMPTTPRYHPPSSGNTRSELKVEHKEMPYLPAIRHLEAPYLHVERVEHGQTLRVIPGDLQSALLVPPMADSECRAFSKLWPGKRESRLEFAISTRSELYLTDISFSEIKHLMSVGCCPLESTSQNGAKLSFRHSTPATIGQRRRPHHHTKSRLIDADFVFLDRVRSFYLKCGKLEFSPLALQRTVTNARVLIQEHLVKRVQSLLQRHKSGTQISSEHAQ